MTPRGQQRELNDRHKRAILALDRAPDRRLAMPELRQAVGAYATNTVFSLQERELLERDPDDETRFRLTREGRLLAFKLRSESGRRQAASV